MVGKLVVVKAGIRMQKQIRFTFRARCALAFVLALLIALTAYSGLAAEGNRSSRVQAGSLGYAPAIPMVSGVWQTSRKAEAASVGQREFVSLPLTIGAAVPSGEKFRITIESDSLDLATAGLGVVIETDGVRLFRELTLTQRRNREELTSDLSIDGQLLNQKAKVSLLFSALRQKEGGKVEMSANRVNPTNMDANAIVRIGAYTIRKQGKGAGPVETAAGLSGMIKVDVAYIISKGDREMIRVMMDGGEVLGLAIREGGVVAGVEYDLDRKIYVNALTQKQVLSKDELIDIFNDLNFSFMRPPDEGKWLAQQEGYSWNKSFAF